MNPEYRVTTAQLVIEPTENTSDQSRDSTFTLSFNLEGIDESFFFDENQEEPDELPAITDMIVVDTEKMKKVTTVEAHKQSPLFSEWLHATIPSEESDIELPKVFRQAEKKGKNLTNQLRGISAAGLGSVGRVFSSLSSIVGACGPLCAHTLGALGNAGSSLGSASVGFPGLNMQGFSVDNKGNFRLDGNIDTLSNITGISSSDLRSGRFSNKQILATFFSAFGDSLHFMCGFGMVETLIDSMFDCLLPSTSKSSNLPATAS